MHQDYLWLSSFDYFLLTAWFARHKSLSLRKPCVPALQSIDTSFTSFVFKECGLNKAAEYNAKDIVPLKNLLRRQAAM